MENEITAIKTIRNAYQNRKPDNVILHSDHGAVYFGKRYMNYCKSHNIRQSNARVSKHLDNRPIEYLFSILKHEWLYRMPPQENEEKLRSEIKKFIYFYNNQRVQSCLNWKTPVEFRKEKRNLARKLSK